MCKNSGYFYLFIGCLGYSCGSSPEEVKPERQSISESVYASGKVVSQNQYEVMPNANGTVHELFVREGDTVNAGTPLLALSNESTELNREVAALARDFSERKRGIDQLKELEVKIDLAYSRMQHDSLLWVRQKNLRQKGVGTQLDLEQRKLAFEDAQTVYETARLQYRELERQMDYKEKNASKNLEIAQSLESDLVVSSEIAGKVYSLLVEKGERVTTQTPVAVVGDAENFVLELQVDEYDIAKIDKDLPIKVTMDSYRGQVFDAQVTSINPMMDERSKTFTVEAAFVTPPAKLYPNLTLEANILIQKKEEALLLPSGYIYQDQYVITASRDTVPVKTGIKDYRKTEILEGIDENTVVVKPQ